MHERASDGHFTLNRHSPIIRRAYSRLLMHLDFALNDHLVSPISFHPCVSRRDCFPNRRRRSRECLLWLGKIRAAHLRSCTRILTARGRGQLGVYLGSGLGNCGRCRTAGTIPEFLKSLVDSPLDQLIQYARSVQCVRLTWQYVLWSGSCNKSSPRRWVQPGNPEQSGSHLHIVCRVMTAGQNQRAVRRGEVGKKDHVPASDRLPIIGSLRPLPHGGG